LWRKVLSPPRRQLGLAAAAKHVDLAPKPCPRIFRSGTEALGMNTIGGWLTYLFGLGLESKDLSIQHICLRGVIIFIVALTLVRLSDRRSLSKKSPFDIILVVILASVLSRAINGSASFFPSIVGAAVLVFLHRVLAFACARSSSFSWLVKGRPALLVRDGQWESAMLRRKSVAREDVLEDMRLNAQVRELEKIEIATLEASGDISFILRKGPP
jgi:uncharacterized membrane protein YcaP (DUF421 family)